MSLFMCECFTSPCLLAGSKQNHCTKFMNHPRQWPRTKTSTSLCNRCRQRSYRVVWSSHLGILMWAVVVVVRLYHTHTLVYQPFSIDSGVASCPLILTGRSVPKFHAVQCPFWRQSGPHSFFIQWLYREGRDIIAFMPDLIISSKQ